jgi:UDP-N-acetylmuramoylalanine--D-glutamate ligase
VITSSAFAETRYCILVTRAGDARCADGIRTRTAPCGDNREEARESAVASHPDVVIDPMDIDLAADTLLCHPAFRSNRHPVS